ncbi:hypothetical protein QUF76_10815 [Desulfobacterales bacterium HSG16]|nr:hypothetical protein [Desulfobacterales bacterium HSG16]
MKKDEHLNEDQIICAIVDENDLSKDKRSHLYSCQKCNDKKMALMSDLESFGSMAENFSPDREMTKKIVYKRASFFRFNFPTIWTAAGALLVLVCIWSFAQIDFSPESLDMPINTMSAELQLIEDFSIEDESELNSSALTNGLTNGFTSVFTTDYQDIISVSVEYFDEDFLEFIAPLEESADSV